MLSVAAVGAIARYGHADVYTWATNTSSTWQNYADWTDTTTSTTPATPTTSGTATIGGSNSVVSINLSSGGTDSDNGGTMVLNIGATDAVDVITGGVFDSRGQVTNAGLLENTSASTTLTIENAPVLNAGGTISATAGTLNMKIGVTGGTLIIGSLALATNNAVGGSAETFTTVTIANAGTFTLPNVDQSGSNGRAKLYTIDGGSFANSGLLEVVNPITTIANGAAHTDTIDIGTGANATTLSNTGTIVVSNASTSAFADTVLMQLGSNVTFTNAGSISVATTSSLGNQTATLASVNTLTNNGNVTVGGGTAQAILSVTGPGQSYVQSAGSTTFSGNGTLSASSLTVSGGTFDVGATKQSVATVTLSGGTVQSTGGAGTLTASSLSISGTGSQIASGTVAGNAKQAANSTLAVNGILTGTDSLASGASLSGNGSVGGAITLVGTDTLTGVSGSLTVASLAVSGAGNSISSGTVAATGGAALTGNLSVMGTLNGAVADNSGGNLSGNGTVGGNITLASGGAISPGNGTALGALSTGNVSFASSGSTLNAYLGNPGSASLLAVTGNISGAPTLSLAAAATGTPAAGVYQLATFTAASTPTLPTVATFGSGASQLHGTLSNGGTGAAASDGLLLTEYRLASASNIATPVALTMIHVGGIFGTSALSVTNNAATDGFSETLDGNISSVTGNASGSGTFTGLAAGSVNASSLTVGLGSGAQNAAGIISGTAVVGLASDGAGLDSAGTTPLASQTVTISGAVYSGASTWTGGSGNFSTGSNWVDSGNSSIHAAPGSFAGYNNDTATFTGANAGTVTLDANPVLGNISVTGGTYTFNTGTGSSLTASSGSAISGGAAVTLGSGVSLNSNVSLSGATLGGKGAVNGTITADGTSTVAAPTSGAFTMGNLSLTSGSTLSFTGFSLTTGGTPLVDSGALSLPSSGNVTISLDSSDASLTNGNYTLVQYSTIANFSAGNFSITGASFPGSKKVTITDNTATDDLDLTVANSAHPIISLTNSAPTGYGSALGTLTVAGANGSYKVAQESTGNVTAAYLPIAGFSPATDTQDYALEVLYNGAPANSGELTTLINDINSGSSTGYGSVVSTISTSPNSPAFNSANYNLYLSFSGSALPTNNTLPDYFAFDVSSGNDSDLGNYTISAVAVVPEPTSLGMLAIGSLAAFSRRRRRSKA